MKPPARHLLAVLLASALTQAYAAPTEGVLSLAVNGQDRGAVPVLLTETGAWLIGDVELKALGISTKQSPHKIEGKSYFPLSQLEGVQSVINEETLTATLTADPKLLSRQVISLVAKPASVVTPSSALSAYLNYQVGVYSETSAGPSLAFDGAVRSLDWLLDTQGYYQQGTSTGLVKKMKVTRDWPDQMVRLEIGDLPAQSSVPGQSLAMRGVSLSRAFETQPYFQRMGGANFSGNVGVPAEAEVKVDGVTIRTVQLNPGSFDINSLAYRTGLHNAVIVIRDKSGNVLSTVGGPTYFSSLGLAKDVTDYGLSIGRLGDGAHADKTGFSARYAKGVTDALTLGVSTQGEGAQRYASTQATWTAGPVGIVSGQLTKAMGEAQGNGVDAAYTWQATHTSMNLSAQRYSKGFFGKALDAVAGSTPLQALSGTVAYSMISGRAISATLSKRRYLDNTEARAISVGYNHRIGNMNIFAQLARVVGTAFERGVSANVLLSWDLGDSRHTTAYATKTVNGSNVRVDTSRITPDEAGFGYRVSAQADDVSQASGYFEYGFKNSIISTNVATTGKQTVGAAFLTSSLAYVDGNMRATRLTRDSFAIADVGLPNVRVLRNNQLVGVTGEDGKLLVPYLAAYSANQITLVEQDVPADYSLDNHMQVVTPARQAGLVVDFNLHPVRSAGGRIAGVQARDPDAALALKDHRDREVALTSNSGASKSLLVRSDGTFYFEELLEGIWTGTMATEGNACRIRLVVPERKEPYLDLGEIDCEKL